MNTNSLKQWARGQQWFLWGTVSTMITLSLISLYSLLYSSIQITIFYHQIVYIFVGLFLSFFVTRYDYRVFRKHIILPYLVSLFLLAAVLVVGLKINGTTGWLNFKFFVFQPVELAKLATILALGSFFAKYHNHLYSWKVILFSLVIPMPLIGLTLAQPDLGSSLVIIGIWFGMFLASPATNSKKLLFIILGLILAFSSWFFFLKEYQKARLGIFLHPEQDPLGVGYNTLQSVTAIGSGGLKGKGLGFGSQSQLHFLPEAHSDFIFAVFSEETGWIGAIIFFVIVLFFYYSIFNIAKNSRDNFGYFVSIGIFWFFFIHLFFNIGMNIGIMPVIGLPLPFISAGGTNLFISFILVGLLQSIGRFGMKH